MERDQDHAALLGTLSVAVSEIINISSQNFTGEQKSADDSFENTISCSDMRTCTDINNLVLAIEAVFSNGFKKITVFLFGEKDYTDFLSTCKSGSVICAKALDAVAKLPKAKSSKGKGRAFFASLLFKKSIEDAITQIIQNPSLNEFYESNALLRDSEKVSMFLGILSPLAAVSLRDGSDTKFFKDNNFDKIVLQIDSKSYLQVAFQDTEPSKESSAETQLDYFRRKAKSDTHVFAVLTESAAQAKTLKTELEKTKKTIETNEREIEQYKTIMKTSQSERNEMKKEIELLRKENDEMRKQNQTQNQNQNNNTLKSTNGSEVANLKNEINSLQEKLKTFETISTENKATKEIEFEEKLKALSLSKDNEMKEKVSILQEEISKLKQFRSESESKAEIISRMELENKELKTNNDILQQKISLFSEFNNTENENKNENENENISEKQNESDGENKSKFLSTVEQYITTNAKLKAEIETLQNESNNIKETSARKTNEVFQLESELKRLEKEIQELKAKNDEDRETHKKVLDEAKHSFEETVQKDLNIHSEQMKKANEDNLRLSALTSSLNEEISMIKNQMASEKRAFGESSLKIQELTLQLDESKSQVSSLLYELENCKGDLKRSEEAQKVLSDNLNHTLSELETRVANFETIEQKSALLRKDVIQLTKAVESYRTENERLEQKNAENDKQRVFHDSQIRLLTEQSEAQNKLIESSQNTLNDFRLALEESKLKNNTISSELSNTKTALSEIEVSSERLRKECAEYTNANLKTAEKLKSLTTQLNEKITYCNELETTVLSLKQNTANAENELGKALKEIQALEDKIKEKEAFGTALLETVQDLNEKYKNAVEKTQKPKRL